MVLGTVDLGIESCCLKRGNTKILFGSLCLTSVGLNWDPAYYVMAKTVVNLHFVESSDFGILIDFGPSLSFWV